jgi:hypothetical protein
MEKIVVVTQGGNSITQYWDGMGRGIGSSTETGGSVYAILLESSTPKDD